MVFQGRQTHNNDGKDFIFVLKCATIIIPYRKVKNKVSFLLLLCQITFNNCFSFAAGQIRLITTFHALTIVFNRVPQSSARANDELITALTIDQTSWETPIDSSEEFILLHIRTHNWQEFPPPHNMIISLPLKQTEADGGIFFIDENLRLNQNCLGSLPLMDHKQETVGKASV